MQTTFICQAVEGISVKPCKNEKTRVFEILPVEKPGFIVNADILLKVISRSSLIVAIRLSHLRALL